MLALPALYIADVAELEYELSANRLALTVTGERTLPDIEGEVIKPLPDRKFSCRIDFPSPVTLVGLEVKLDSGVATMLIKKATSEKVDARGNVIKGVNNIFK